MGDSSKKFFSALRGIGSVSTSGTVTLKSTTCPPPGATIIKTVWIICLYKDAQGNTGWCILK
ncbi:MAG: hypothetical protein KJ737_12355 [Proteobacteria bacterium]|nr:hypothetical protein [Pseudomonadota bacterium]